MFRIVMSFKIDIFQVIFYWNARNYNVKHPKAVDNWPFDWHISGESPPSFIVL